MIDPVKWQQKYLAVIKSATNKEYNKMYTCSEKRLREKPSRFQTPQKMSTKCCRCLFNLPPGIMKCKMLFIFYFRNLRF